MSKIEIDKNCLWGQSQRWRPDDRIKKSEKQSPSSKLYSGKEHKVGKCSVITTQNLLLVEKKSLLKRFFTDALCPLITSSVTALSSSMHSYGEKAKEATPLRCDIQSPKVLAVEADEFDVLPDVIPMSTFRDMVTYAEALLNEPDAIMQAAANDLE